MEDEGIDGSFDMLIGFVGGLWELDRMRQSSDICKIITTLLSATNLSIPHYRSCLTNLQISNN